MFHLFRIATWVVSVLPGNSALRCIVVPLTLIGHVSAAQASQPVDQTTNPSGSHDLHSANTLLRSGDYAEALLAFETLAEDSQTADMATLGVARSMARVGRYQEALARLSSGIGSPSPQRLYVQAQIESTIGQYDQVLEHTARAIKLDPDHAGARLLRAQTLELLGRRDQAIGAYRWFDRQMIGQTELPRDAQWLTLMGRGFLRYSVLTHTSVVRRTSHVLNEMLQMAYGRIDRTYWPARIASADLLRERHNNKQEDGSVSDYRGALFINPNLPEAHVGLGEVALEQWDFDAAQRHAQKALEVNQNFVPALNLLGRKLLIERRFDDAVEAGERALKVNAFSLEALAICAAGAACRYDQALLEKYEKRAAAVNPRSALFKRIIADAVGAIRQYEASEKFYRDSIEFDPTDANARAELGMMYMQWGYEDRAREALESAWNLDSFNERTHFLLELLETLEKFARLETEHFIIKFKSETDPGIGEFLAGYLEELYESVTEDYETHLSDKTIVEIFPTLRAFGVRISGRPWIHTVGACTGRVIALTSPNDKSGIGPYDLARVLRHEFTHTVTLSATDNRIPHWFTEGLAVYQEDVPRSFTWSDLLAQAVRRDELFPLDSIRWGFWKPRRPSDRQLAYAQSEWMCEYIVERYGYETINHMLGLFKKRMTQSSVFQELLKIELEQFDREFQTWASERVARWGFDVTPPEEIELLQQKSSDQPSDASLLARLAKAHLDGDDYHEAFAVARKSLALDENNRIALSVLATVFAQSTRDEKGSLERAALDEQAEPILQRLLQVDPSNWLTPRSLAEMALRQGDTDQAIEHYRKLQAICPIDPASWRGLAGLYLRRGDSDLALTQLVELAHLGEADAQELTKIGRLYDQSDRLRESVFWYRRSLFLNPADPGLQRQYAEASLRNNDPQSALRAYMVLTKLEPQRAAHFEAAAIVAHKLGNRGKAQELARAAVKLDPTSAARSLLEE